MNRTPLALCLLLSSVWLGVAVPGGHAAQLAPLGPEIALLDFGASPNVPALAAQPDGAYVVAWDNDDDYPEYELFYRYVAAGREPGYRSPSWFDSPEGALVVHAVVAVRKGFDVLWYETESDENYNERITGFFRQHLSLRGVPEGKPIRMGGKGAQWLWHVRGNGYMEGRSLPRQHSIVARRLTSSGQPTGPELRLNSRPVDNVNPVVLGVADGGFLAVWRGDVPGPTRSAALRARRFSPSGKPLGPDFDINTLPLNAAAYPEFQVASAPGGGFAVSWLVRHTLYLRLFNAAGVALGPEIQVAKSKDFDEGPQSMAFDNAGNLLLLWRQYAEGVDLLAQLIDPRGALVGPPVNVRSEASEIDGDLYDGCWYGRVAWAGDSWLVTWWAHLSGLEYSTIFVRRFGEKK